MVKIINPIWDQTTKPGSKPGPTQIRDDAPQLKTRAQREQDALAKEQDAEAAGFAEVPRAAEAARFEVVAGQKRSVPEAAVERGPAPSSAVAPNAAAPEAVAPDAAAPHRRVSRRPHGKPPERRSIQAGYDVVCFQATPENSVPQSAFGRDLSEPVIRQSLPVTQKSLQTAPRPQIVVCLQYPRPEESTSEGLDGRAKEVRLVDSQEVRTAYVGEAIYFAEPLSISVAVSGGFNTAEAKDTADALKKEAEALTQNTGTEAWTGTEAGAWTAVLMPTRYAPRIPKLSHVIALALRQQKERFSQATANELMTANELTKLCETGADVFLFAPHPSYRPGNGSSQRDLDHLPECPVPGTIRLPVPDLAVAGKSVQRKLEVFLVDLSPGARPSYLQRARQSHLPPFPEPFLAASLDFDWAALLEGGREEYEAAAADQAQQVLQYVLNLRNTGCSFRNMG